MRRCYKNASDDSHNTCVMKFLVHVWLAALGSSGALTQLIPLRVSLPPGQTSARLTNPKFQCLDKQRSWFHPDSCHCRRMGKLQLQSAARPKTERYWLPPARESVIRRSTPRNTNTPRSSQAGFPIAHFGLRERWLPTNSARQ